MTSALDPVYLGAAYVIWIPEMLNNYFLIRSPGEGFGHKLLHVSELGGSRVVVAGDNKLIKHDQKHYKTFTFPLQVSFKPKPSKSLTILVKTI